MIKIWMLFALGANSSFPALAIPFASEQECEKARVEMIVKAHDMQKNNISFGCIPVLMENPK